MSTASAVATAPPVTTDRARESAGVRRLVVPIGGTGWGWGLLSRFMIFFSLTFVMGMLPWSPVSTFLSQITYGPPPYLAQHFPLFGIPEGDGRFYQHLVPLVVAGVWLLLDRKRKHEVLIAEIGQLMARYGIAYILSSYALEKTFGAQGSGTYTEYSGLLAMYGVHTRGFTTFLWLGQSIIYENFAALVELLPLFLITFRRTAVWGTIVAFAACLNVWVVNTGHWNTALALTPIAMIAMPIALLIPYTKRFFQLFTGQPVEPTMVGYLTPPSFYWPVAAVTKTIVILWSLYSHSHFFAAAPEYWRSPLAGLYRVDRFTRNGKEEPLAAEFPNRWKEVTIGTAAENISTISVDGEKVSYYIPVPGTHPRREKNLEKWTALTSKPEGDIPFNGGMATGLEHGTLEIGERSMAGQRRIMTTDSGKLHYTHPRPGLVTLSAVIGGDTIVAELHRLSIEAQPLYRFRLYPERWRQVIALWARDRNLVYPY